MKFRVSAKCRTNRGGAPQSTHVLGFSTRSLTYALHRLHVSVRSLDYFGDHDLRQMAADCETIGAWQPNVAAESQIRRLFQKMLGDHRRPKLILAGGVENWPELLTLSHEYFDVLGPTVDQLALLRSLDFWQRSAESTGIRVPRTATAPQPGRWLRKPRGPLQASCAGAGGMSISRFEAPFDWDSDQHEPESLVSEESHQDANRWIYQEEILGAPIGAVCILSRTDGSGALTADLQGATESWSATDWPGPTDFIYRGSWGPIHLTRDQSEAVLRLAAHAASECPSVGWLPMDFIRDAAGQLWFLECNPRWTSGMECLTDADLNPCEAHLYAWGFRTDKEQTRQSTQSMLDPDSRRVSGKAIVYLERDTTITEQLLERLHSLPASNYADVPSSHCLGQVMRLGQPLLTVKTIASVDKTAGEHLVRRQMLNQLWSLRQPIMNWLTEA